MTEAEVQESMEMELVQKHREALKLIELYADDETLHDQDIYKTLHEHVSEILRIGVGLFASYGFEVRFVDTLPGDACGQYINESPLSQIVLSASFPVEDVYPAFHELMKYHMTGNRGYKAVFKSC